MKLELPVIFEDQDVLVVSKPYGVVVNRAQSYEGETVQDWMEAFFSRFRQDQSDWQALVPADFSDHYGTPEQIFVDRIGMVHRLDKDTSGVLILAKNPGSLVNLLAQFRTRTVQKQYVCLVHGKFTLEMGTVTLPIARRSDNRMRFGVVPEGRPAVTEYHVQQYYPNFDQSLLPKAEQGKRFGLYQGFSLVACCPKTGRTHQIRVHMQHLQHPIVGDQLYVGKKRAKLDARWCPRQFLHAQQLTFTHPRTQQQITVEAPLADDLKAVLRFVGDPA